MKKEFLKEYEYVSDEIKYLNNSHIRLNILFSLLNNPLSMKEVYDKTKINYGSLSYNIKNLMVQNCVLYEMNDYFLSNSCQIYVKNLKEFKETLSVLEDFFELFDDHKIKNISQREFFNMVPLKDCEIIESGGVKVGMIRKLIKDTIKDAEKIKAILPVSFPELMDEFENSIAEEKIIDLVLFKEISYFNDEEINSYIQQLSYFNNNFNFLLIVTNEIFLFGLYKKEGIFDQNRLLVGDSDDSLKWANNLFNDFKMEMEIA